MKNASLLLFLITASGQVSAQFEWQDPLQLGKEWLVYNLIGVGGSLWLGENDPGAKGWFSGFYVEYQQGYGDDDTDTDVFAGKARFGYQLRRWIGMGGEVQFLKFKNTEVSTPGLGSNIWFNWNFLNRPKFRAYFDNGFGIVGTAKEFPQGGTKFNFSTTYGLGVDLKIRDGTMVKLGVRNMHISNAYLFGDDRNPAFDSIGFLIGFQFQ